MLGDLTRKLRAGGTLDRAEAASALECILEEDRPDVQIEEFLAALHEKGETAEEIAGFAGVMRSRSVAVRTSHSNLVDTAGTGGGADTFNVSTTAAFVIAGAGQPIAKHGNRAVTSRSGSADVLSALGVDIDAPARVAAQCLEAHGLAFLFAPLFHPAMKRVAEIRRRLPHRTIFNLLGPLTNPAAAPFQIVGVYAPELTETVGRALSLLGCRRGWVVHSQDGMDEISCLAPTRVTEVKGHQTRSLQFAPEEWGFHPDAPPHRGGAPSENAAVCRGILSGEISGASRDIVILNAAAALHVAGIEDFGEAIEAARRALHSGAAARKLEDLASAYAAR